MHDFQFFDQDRIKELFQREFELSNQKRSIMRTIKDMRTQEARQRRAASKMPERAQVEKMMEVEKLGEEIKLLEARAALLVMSSEEKAERDRLIAQGMGSWSKTDFRKFCSACERHGRKAKVRPCSVHRIQLGCAAVTLADLGWAGSGSVLPASGC